jgi:hypothetical protein
VYQQTPNQLYQQSSLTLKVGYAWAAPRVPLDLAGNIFGTVAPLVDNSPESTGWVLGMNVRLGVRVTPRYWRWRLSLALGYYNVSFLDSNRAFGFTFLNGPEVYPALSFRWKKNRLGVYFKFAPVWNGQGFNSLASRELATGFSYSRSLKQGFDVVESGPLIMLQRLAKLARSIDQPFSLCGCFQSVASQPRWQQLSLRQSASVIS